MTEEKRYCTWHKDKALEGIREQLLKESRLDRVVEIESQYQKVHNLNYQPGEWLS